MEQKTVRKTVDCPACIYVLYIMSYDPDPKLVNCGLSSISLCLVGGGDCVAHVTDLDAKRGAKSETMCIKQGDASRG